MQSEVHLVFVVTAHFHPLKRHNSDRKPCTQPPKRQMELHLKIKNPIVNEWLSTLTGPSPITFAPKTSKEAKKHDEKRVERKSAVAPAPASVPNAPSSSSKRPLPSSSRADEREAPVLKKPVLWKAVTPKFSGRYLGERPEDVDRLVSPPWLPSLPKIGSLRVEKGKVQVIFHIIFPFKLALSCFVVDV
jgi:hypothetical protein